MGFEITPMTQEQAMRHLRATGEREVLVFVGLVGLTTTCYQCGRQGVAVPGVVVERGAAREFFGLDDDMFLDFEPLGEALRKSLDPVWMREHFVGPFKVRTSRPRPEGYMSNGCHSCDAIIGSHPLREAVRKIDPERLPEFVVRQVSLPLSALREAVESGTVQRGW